MDIIPDLPQGLNKNRVEALSDGVFSIAMTILVFDIKVPAAVHGVLATGALQALLNQWAYFLAYFVSFTVLGMFWTSHNAFFHFFSRTVNRVLIQINMIYLVFIGLIPFSAHFLGTYVNSRVAIAEYGANIIIIGTLAYCMFVYALYSHDIDTSHIPSRVIKQFRIRILLTPSFAALGLVSMFVYPHLALFFFAFPVIFNILPGTLDLAEKVLGVKLT